MSIEINYEALSELSIADLIALDKKLKEWSEIKFLNERIAISEELRIRINNIFIN